MKRRLREISPNAYNRTLFSESLSPESIQELAKDIKQNGLHYPIRITKVGKVIIDGERRARACMLLKWKTIEVTEEDVKDPKDIYEMVIAAAASQRQMSLFEQARVYQSYYLHLKRLKTKDSPSITEAKKAAIQVARLPYGITCSDQLVYLLERGSEELRQRVASGEVGISAAYEQLERREYKHMTEVAPVGSLIFPEPTPAQIERHHVREQVKKESRFEREIFREETKKFIVSHQESLESEEAARQLVELYEPDPAPRLKTHRERDEATVIQEAINDLALKEPPEILLSRLTTLIETTILSIHSVDEQRARDLLREVIKPMILRLSKQFPREEFDPTP